MKRDGQGFNRVKRWLAEWLLLRACKKLSWQLDRKNGKAWVTYIRVLELAMKVDIDKLLEVISQFDRDFEEQSDIGNGRSAIAQALAFLLDREPQTLQNLDAAWQISQHLSNSSAKQEIQQKICLQVAQKQEGGLLQLLERLEQRYTDGSLTREYISEIVKTFLQNSDSPLAPSWRAFFEKLSPEEFPQIHQVYAVLNKHIEAIKLAERDGEYRAALIYFNQIPPSDEMISPPVLTLVERLVEQLDEKELIGQAHKKLAESFQKAEKYQDALKHFEKAGEFRKALLALEAASPKDKNTRKARLLKSAGDFLGAAHIYEGLNQIDEAIDCYKQAENFSRAAKLRKAQIPDDQKAFDDTLLDLLEKAKEVEWLAEFVWDQVKSAEQSDKKVRLLLRIKRCQKQGLVGEQWLERVEDELHGQFTKNMPGWVEKARKQVFERYSKAIGLDMGTSHSVVCLYNKKDQKAEVATWKGKELIPSVFAIDKSGTGRVGVSITDTDEDILGIIQRAKRYIGTDRKFRLAGKEYRAEEVLAHIVGFAYQVAKDYLQEKVAEEVSRVAALDMGPLASRHWVDEWLEKNPSNYELNGIVMTVPAYFQESQKKATKNITEIAGISLRRLIHEPTAACLALASTNALLSQRILVADLGAGTFDLSLIEIQGGNRKRAFTVKWIEGDGTLGSSDVDDLIYKYFTTVIKSKLGRSEEIQLRQACERLKKDLSDGREEATIKISLAGAEEKLSLTQEKLQCLVEGWLGRIHNACQKTKSKAPQPNSVWLVGGGMRMPAVRECIRQVLGREVRKDDALLLTSVACGAALHAAILEGDIAESSLKDVTPFCLGVKVIFEHCEYPFTLRRFSPIDDEEGCVKEGYVTTSKDDETECSIVVTQGESPNINKNPRIATSTLSDIPRASKGIPRIKVRLKVDKDCLLTVTATDERSKGNKVELKIEDIHLDGTLSRSGIGTAKEDFKRLQGRKELENRREYIEKILGDIQRAGIDDLSIRFQHQCDTYEKNQANYEPTKADADILMEMFREAANVDAEKETLRLKRDALFKDTNNWLQGFPEKPREEEWQDLFDKSAPLLECALDIRSKGTAITIKYEKWLSTLEHLPLASKGTPEEQAQYFLRQERYPEALTQFRKLESPLDSGQLRLGLEILARNYQRDKYKNLRDEYAQKLGLRKLKMEDLDGSSKVRQAHASSIVQLKIKRGAEIGSGSGFLIDSDLLATNRHVVVPEGQNDHVEPRNISIITQKGEQVLEVIEVHIPIQEDHDVAILQVREMKPGASEGMTPLRLGFSEIVELNDFCVVIGFPGSREIEVGIGNIKKLASPLFDMTAFIQEGMSGSPVLNRAGEVIGIATSGTLRERDMEAYHGTPVNLLHRLLKNKIGRSSHLLANSSREESSYAKYHVTLNQPDQYDGESVSAGA